MKILQKVAALILTICIPLVLILTAIRLLLTPVFVSLEYRVPGFPADPYGFSQQERIGYARLALEYLLNTEGINFLGDQTFPDGFPLYNERELSHMVDVKNLVQVALRVWLALLALVALLAVWAKRSGWWKGYLQALVRGGWLTVGLVVAILVLVAVSFNGLFTAFHALFFEGDSWLFLYSDTLIRLFPLRFWQDCFIGIGVFSLAGGLALGLGLRNK